MSKNGQFPERPQTPRNKPAQHVEPQSSPEPQWTSYGQPGANYSYQGPTNSSRSAKSSTGLIAGVIAGVTAISVAVTIAVLTFNGLDKENTFTTSSETKANSPYSESEPFSYEYGAQSKESIFGVNATNLRTAEDYKLSESGSPAYSSADGKCDVLVNSGYAPEGYLNTGDDGQATEQLVSDYFGDVKVTDKENRLLKYKSSTVDEAYAPAVYAEGVAKDKNSDKKVGVYGRIISGGPGMAITITMSCDSQNALTKTAKDIESNVQIQAADTVY